LRSTYKCVGLVLRFRQLGSKLMAKKIISSEHNQIDQRELRNALGRFATGITVVTTTTDDGVNEALTANSFAALSLDPPLVLWSLTIESPSRVGFLSAGRFAINVLGAHQRSISNQFAQSAQDKFDGIAWHHGRIGCPILDDHLAVFECSTERAIESGDHLLFIGRVEGLSYREGAALVYSAGKYCMAAELPDDNTTGETTFTDILRWS